ncbi:MAG: multiphosphoryl transfer protein [Actinomycetota bacterium]|nr:multiphosphoryl transfer protein [Actinomycetota bacterium]
MSSSTVTSRATRVTILAPVRGVLVPMETIPDPVFAQKLVGEGISIDPLEGRLHAPVAGEVSHLHPSAHALTLRTPEGLEILVHIGLDTVRLRGEGFTTHVRMGDSVRAGDLLISFDLDHLALHAKSLLTQVVVTNTAMITSLTPRTGAVSVGDPVADITLPGAGGGSGDGADTAAAGQRVTSPAILVPNPSGLHARPAATLANQAQQFRSQIWLVMNDVQVNAKSIMAVMGLEVTAGATVRIVASGPDAEQAAETLSAAVAAGLGEEIGTSPVSVTRVSVRPVPATVPPAPSVASAVLPATTPVSAPVSAPAARPGSGAAGQHSSRELRGAAASPGLAVGTIVQVRREDVEVTEEATDHHAERRRLNDAIDRAQTQLWALENRLTQEADADKAAIFAAHAEILRDPDLLDLAASGIDKGKSAAYAWRAAYSVYADRLAALRSEVLAGRAIDVRDVGQRVLEELIGRRGERASLPPHTILVAEDLSPSDTATLDRSLVVGFVTTGGGASSHVAILARSLDIPAVAGIDARVLTIPDGTRAVLDGGAGTLRFDVTDSEVERIWSRQARRTERRAVELAHAEEPAVTRDGHRVEVVANIAGVDDARTALAKGAEGVGLLRSEFLFLDRRTAPTEDEQSRVYRQVAESLPPGAPLVIRTLDVGGDKPLPYLPIPPEENPFLGERGVRVALARPEVLRTQVRAILRAAGVGARLHVMFPMVATLDEYRQARAILEEERVRLGAPEVPVGVMVEVPSVALTAARFAEEVDFFSIGTNDLTQYTLAMDRGHPKLAPQVDGLHPAVLTLIGQVAAAATAAGRWAGICGSIASDPQAVPLLIGLGVHELSVSVPALPSVKAQIRTLSLESCRELAAQALAADSAASVRALVPTVDEEEIA